MSRALELAELGRGSVAPNPLVGCVIEHEGKIIGEGYHKKYGESHAEVNAVRSVKEPKLLPSSTLYVTLEPCAHHGKTPPCADMIVRNGIKKVVIACRDPFEKVDGKGIEKLEAGGVQVELGMLGKEAVRLNERFFTFHQEKRPFVILKWAQTSDGFIAREDGDSKWISNSYSRQLVHKWRAEEDAILVGKNTALADDPSLTVRNAEGKNPIRILLDSNLALSESQKLFNGEAETLIFNTSKAGTRESNHWIQTPEISPQIVLAELYKRKIQSVIIEGGTQTLNSFIVENCWDEARVFQSETSFQTGIAAPSMNRPVHQRRHIQNDQLLIYKNHG